MAYQNLTLEHADDGRIALVTVNRPTALNALNTGVLDELIHAMTAVAADQAVRAVLLIGAVAIMLPRRIRPR